MNEILKRKEHETDFEYKIRLCNSKLNKEINLDWYELVELLNLDCSSDHLRKLSYAYKEYSEYLEKKEINSVDSYKLLEEIELKKQELREERIKLRTENVERNRFEIAKSRKDLCYEKIADRITTLPVPTLEPIYPNKDELGYILDFSDIHYNAEFKSITNSYSRDIAKERFEKLLGEVFDFIDNNKVNTLYVVNGGDSLQGMLRMSDLKLNDMGVIDSLVEFQKVMATFLNELSRKCNVRYYHVNSANHTEVRLLNAKAGSMSVEDLEKIIVNYLHDVLEENPRVYINKEFCQDTIQFNMNGFEFICIHGHQLKNIKNGIKDLSDKWDKKFDYLILGHYHSGIEMVVGEREGYAKEVLVCPSFVGTCPYADKLMVGGKAMAKIHTFKKKKGRINTFNIILN